MDFRNAKKDRCMSETLARVIINVGQEICNQPIESSQNGFMIFLRGLIGGFICFQ